MVTGEYDISDAIGQKASLKVDSTTKFANYVTSISLTEFDSLWYYINIISYQILNS